MNALDNQFFEEYKRLDKLCGEIFSCPHGVSEYITQMERMTAGGARFLPDTWDEDYKTLKHLRWVCNRIAHDDVDGQLCERNDLAQVKAFRERILKGDDPISLQRKRPGVARRQRQPMPRRPAAPHRPPVRWRAAFAPKRRRRSSLGGLLIAAVFLLALLGVILGVR